MIAEFKKQANTNMALHTKILFCLAIIILAGLSFSCSDNDPAIAAIESYISSADIDFSRGDWKQNLPKPPQLEFSLNKRYLWKLQTNKGNITIEFKPIQSPMHVSSTIYLTKLGFYDELTFHRVIPKFMAQGGDPLGVGVGGPGYQYMGEFKSKLSHDKAGVLSMANSGAGTDGSQFFITYGPDTRLDGKYTIFGQVIDGMAALKIIEKYGSRLGPTTEKIVIVKATIVVE